MSSGAQQQVISPPGPENCLHLQIWLRRDRHRQNQKEAIDGPPVNEAGAPPLLEG
jgi:hypothetical protein